jgi:hypothetical protein
MHSPSRIGLRFVGLALMMVLAAFSGGAVASAQTPRPGAPGRSGSQPPAGVRPHLSNPAGARLDSRLNQLVIAAQQGRLSQAADRLNARTSGGSVLVTIKARIGRAAGAAAAAAAQGGRVSARYKDWIDAYVPVTALPALAQQPDVERVDLPTLPHADAVTDEGVAAIGADAWQSAGQTGAGVKVGIVDLGFDGYTGRLGTDLPAAVDTSCNPAGQPLEGSGVTPHGTAVAEIVHKTAPDAQLFFAVSDTAVDLGNIVTCLIARGVTVVNHSISWMYQGPGDGTGLVDDIVNTAVAGGIFWANSAGNAAQNHWGGTWADPNADGWLNFSTNSAESLAVTVGPGGQIVAGLRWNDSWGGACDDFNLYLVTVPKTVDPNEIPAFSENTQDCSASSTPLEVLSYVNQSPATLILYLEVCYQFCSPASGTATARSFDLITFTSPLPSPNRVPANSLFHPADSTSAGMAAVGAVNVAQYATPATIEPFSSRGPTTDGRIKPDIAGPDGVSSSVYGAPPAQGFFGTSASAPHTAGAAALVKGANPTFTPAQVKNFLIGRATPQGSPVPNNTFGYGTLALGAPPAGGGTLGGTGFAVRGPASPSARTVTLSWHGGSGQTGYMVVRLGLVNQGVSVTSLGALAAGYIDTSVPTSTEEPLPCYVLLVMNGSNVAAVSDMLCVAIGVMTATGSPTGFALSLNQGTTASLSWGAPGGQTGYTLFAIPMTGGAVRPIALTATATAATDATGGAMTCYLLAAMNGATTTGVTDILCGVPGVALFPTAARSAGMNVDRAITSIRESAAARPVDPSRLDATRGAAPGRGAPSAGTR